MTQGGLRAAFYLSIAGQMSKTDRCRADEKSFAPDHGSV
jgi:hypothetical protein